MFTQRIVAAVFICLFIISARDVNAQDSSPVLKVGLDYPFSAEQLALGISGEIKLAVEVDQTGKVARAGVYVGPGWPCGKNIDSKLNDLMRSVEKWVGAYQFTPGTKNGKAVDSRIGVNVKIPSEPVSGVVDKKAKLVTGGVINGKALKLERPAYPSAARAERAGGQVRVQVLIYEEGKVMSAQAIDGHPLLMFASRDAACASKFSPTLLAGNPVKVAGVIIYNFVP